MLPAVPGELAKLGVQLSPDWLAACDAHLKAALGGFDRLALPKQVEAVYLHFLESDLNLSGAGCLPPNVEARPRGGGARGAALTRPASPRLEKRSSSWADLCCRWTRW